MVENFDGAPRYSLIAVTDKNERYCYDKQKNRFVKLDLNDTPSKSTLPALDFLTSNFSSREELASTYGITDPIALMYISYQFNGEKKIAPIFNNPVWAHIAITYNGKKINFVDKENLKAFDEVYQEIIKKDSEFVTMLIKGKKNKINISQKSINIIVSLRAHENAIRAKRELGFPVGSITSYNPVYEIYSSDKVGFYNDLKNSISKYREFRSIYMNYCKMFKPQMEQVSVNEEKPKRKVIVNPHQMSMFESGNLE